MSHSYRVTARSAATPSALFDALVRGATWPSWSPLDEVTLEGGGSVDEAQKVGDVRVFRTGRVRSHERVDKLEPPRRFEYSHVGKSPFTDYRGVVELVPAESGTDIHWSATFRPRLPGTGRFWRWYLTRFMQRMADGLAAYAR